MTATTPVFDLFAIRYATRIGRRGDNFIGGDPHDGPMVMDYFCWVAISSERSFVIDCGFTADIARKRGRDHLRCPVQTLRSLGLSGPEVTDLIVTHLHYDHVGNIGAFAKAQVHLQERELRYATGKYMRHRFLNHAFEVEEVVQMVRLSHAGRIVFHDGDAELAPGLSLHLAGGHSAGLQFVRVHTRRGWVVLASDAVHFYENMETGRPFTVVYHAADAVEAFDLVRRQADSPDHIIPGHDPRVMALYPPPHPEQAGIVVRLDVPPVK